MKNKTTAGLLALFLWHFGIHRFYLWKPNWVLYLLFFWTLIPWIIGFIESIQFFSMDNEKFNKIYNNQSKEDDELSELRKKVEMQKLKKELESSWN